MSEETKKRRTVLMEVLIIKSNVNHIIQKIVNVESAVNEAELNIKKLLEAFNLQKEQLNVFEGMLDYLKTNLPTTKPQPLKQSVVPKLPDEIAKQLSFGDGWIQPKGFLPKQVWSEANAALFKQGYKWSSNGKQGAWKKQ